MNAKLTLQLNKSVIEFAKEFAAQNGTSLSKMIEGFFYKFKQSQTKKNQSISPLVKELSGSIEFKGKIDENKIKKEYLSKKYL